MFQLYFFDELLPKSIPVCTFNMYVKPMLLRHAPFSIVVLKACLSTSVSLSPFSVVC